MDSAQAYHGTRRGFTPGGYLMPQRFHQSAEETSAPVAPGRERAPDSGDWVYFTGSLELAWAYAYAAPGRGKPKVLVLDPKGDVEPDPEHSLAMDTWRCSMARVTRVLTDPPMTEAEAAAGWQVAT